MICLINLMACDLVDFREQKGKSDLKMAFYLTVIL